MLRWAQGKEEPFSRFFQDWKKGTLKHFFVYCQLQCLHQSAILHMPHPSFRDSPPPTPLYHGRYLCYTTAPPHSPPAKGFSEKVTFYIDVISEYTSSSTAFWPTRVNFTKSRFTNYRVYVEFYLSQCFLTWGRGAFD